MTRGTIMREVPGNALGRKLRARRKELGLSQQAVAKRMGFSHRQAAGNMEIGLVKLLLEEELELASRAYEIDINDLRKLRPRRQICLKERRSPISNLITWLRAASGLSQQQLALRAGVCLETVHFAEWGKRRICPKTLSKILWALECPPQLVPTQQP